MNASSRGLDGLCVLAIAIACAALWGPAIGIVSLNPDESQYEATASYLVATDTTVFLPSGAPGTFGLWALATRLVGPYPIHWMRALLMVGSCALGVLLFGLVRRDAGRWWALLAAAVALHYAQAFEGLTVNREWLASLCTVLGVALCLRLETGGRRARWPFAVAGFLCGMALWFKLQVSFMVFVVPLAMIVLSSFERSAIRLKRQLPAFAAGGIASAALYLAPFAFQGDLGRFLELVVFDVSVYVGENEAASVGARGGSADYLGRFLLGQPDRSLLLVAYLMAGAVLAACAVRLAGRGGRATSWLTRPTPLVFGIYLPLSMIAVRLGHRFFLHYFQLMLPAVAVLVALAAAFLWREVRDRPAWRWVSLGVGALLVANRLITIPTDPTWSGARTAAVGAATVAIAGALAIAAFWLPRPVRRATAGLALLIALEVGVLAAHWQLAPTPASMSHSPYSFDRLTRFLTAAAEPGDMLFVWGWAPEIYSLTRLTAASHLTSSQYVANDLKGVPDRPALNREWAGLLMAELRETRPRFIVDASARSWYETEPWVYRLRNFPEFALRDMLRRDYRRVGRFDGCDVWERVARR